MGAPTIARLLSEEEYLSNPALAHHEYIDGEAVELNLGTGPHSRIQANCVLLLGQYLKQNRIGTVLVELRCRLQVRGRTRYYLPDVCVVLGQETDFAYLDRAPDFVIEVRSPGDSMTMLARKMSDYFDNGTRTAWLIIPEERAVWVFRPAEPVRVATSGEAASGGDVLPGFELSVDELLG